MHSDAKMPAPLPRKTALLLTGVLMVIAWGCGRPLPSAGQGRQSLPLDGSQTLRIHGHRGARGLRPENTLAAFEAALDLGVDVLELDLHLSADDQVVVWHDPSISSAKCRIPDGSELPDPRALPPGAPALRVRNLSADQLARYRCDLNPDRARFPEQRAEPGELAGDRLGLVTLDVLLTFVESYANSPLKSEAQRRRAASVGFNVETKREVGDPTAIGDGFDGVHAGLLELETLRILSRHHVRGRTIIQSFDPRSLWAVHAEDPSLPLAVLTEELPDMASLASSGATIWSPDHGLVDKASMDAAHRAGLKVIPWTVNEVDEVARLVALGVDGIITDRPDLVGAPKL